MWRGGWERMAKSRVGSCSRIISSLTRSPRPAKHQVGGNEWDLDSRTRRTRKTTLKSRPPTG